MVVFGLVVAAAGCGGSSSETVRGNAVEGKRVFLSAGCGQCHTLKAAHTIGLSGGPLDGVPLTTGFVADRVRKGGGGMPSFDKKLNRQQIDDLAAFVVTASKHPKTP